MTNHEKTEIQTLLAQYVAQFNSQAKAAATLHNVSEATVIQIKNEKWGNISEDMWRNVGKQVGWSSKGKWNVAHTRPFNSFVQLFRTSQDYSFTHAIIAPAGTGKTFAAEWYEKNNRNVYHIVCAEYWTPKNFLVKLLKKMGKEGNGSISDLMDTLIEALLRQDNPIIVLDEADKLRDRTLYFFITLYNMLNNKCGLILMATKNLQREVMRKQFKKGYEEILSRIGRRFIEVKEPTKRDVSAVCEANELTHPDVIMAISNEYDGDLRRVEKAILKHRLMREKNLHLETA